MGKMFEPKTLATNEKINKIALNDFKSTHYWVGVNDIQSEGTWVYTSDGSPIAFSAPWDSSEAFGSRGASNNCVLFWIHVGKWADYPCTQAGIHSFCELEV